MTLHNFVTDKIRAHQSLSFADFMQMALYDPTAGYYTMGMQHFGQDFTTAPQISPLFGGCIAYQCAEIFKKLLKPRILEFGAGSGRLCVDILTRLEEMDALPEIYFILEVSGSLQSQQQQTIQQSIPHLMRRVQWLSAWPTDPFEGVLLANEVLDAMPVHRFVRTLHDLYELYISVTPEGTLCEVLKYCDNERLQDYVLHVLDIDTYPYQSEVNLYLAQWLQHCAKILTRGVMLIIDYGFPRAEYYHPDRNQGTLMCHHRHHAHSNPLIHLGDQDITAHVDFTHVAESAVQAGFSVSGFTSQASFLLSTGLLSLVNSVDPKKLFQQQHAVKLLTHPNEMGELFKVMALSRAWDDSLFGFQLQDRRASL